jgi:hypothetical protein
LERLRSEGDRRYETLSAIKFVAVAVALWIGIDAGGATAGGAISGAGELWYVNETEGGVNVVKLVDIVTRAAQFGAAIQEIVGAWEVGRGSLNEMQGRLNGSIKPKAPAEGEPVPSELEWKKQDVEQFRGAINKFGESSDKLKALLEVAKPQTLELTELEKQDSELQNLLQRQVATTRATNDLLPVVDQARAALVEAQAAVASGYERERDLRRGDPKNDVDLVRWAAAALELRRQTALQLYREAVLVRRGIGYATGSLPAFNAEALYFPDEALAAAQSGISPITAHGKPDPIWLQERLKTENDQLIAAINAVLQLQSDATGAYYQRRTTEDFRVVPVLLSGGTPGSVMGRFMRLSLRSAARAWCAAGSAACPHGSARRCR